VSCRLTALFLACKTEERYYNAQQFATLVRQGPELVDDLLALEHTLIEAIQFDLGVQHPCTALHGLILDARVRRRATAAAHTAMRQDSLRGAGTGAASRAGNQASGRFAQAEAAGVTLDQVRTAAAALLARAVQADVLFEHTPAQVALACFLRACAGAPATQTASMRCASPLAARARTCRWSTDGGAAVVALLPEGRYLSGIVPDEAEQNALLETVRRIQQAIDDHGDVSDETARGIDQKLQRLQTVAPYVGERVLVDRYLHRRLTTATLRCCCFCTAQTAAGRRRRRGGCWRCRQGRRCRLNALAA